ncbi:MAG: glycosyltransferase, partial [Undibacterium sp.]|nr:glycosyltransferase [Undibacterium sp.]
EPKKITAAKIGLVLALLVLTRGWVNPIGIFLSLFALSIYRRQKLKLQLLTISLPIALCLIGIWLLSLHHLQPFSSSPYQAWMEWNYRQIGMPLVENIVHFFRYGIWFTWPAWPFAAWAIYAWRKQESTLHISLPLAFLGCFTVLALLNRSHEEGYLLPLLPPLAILAAFGLPTMKRSAINGVDWFAVTVMTGTAGLFWFGWIALQTGWPLRTSKKILSWAPGLVPEFNIITFTLALAVTVIWFRLVYWRISRQPAVLWRAVVLSSGGVILCWFLLMSLGLPLWNQRVSYALVAQDMAKKITMPYHCIDSKLGASQRASFAYFSRAHFASFTEQNCDLLLTQANRRHQGKSKVAANKDFPGNWEIIWQGQRASDDDEFFTLYRKK